MFFSDLILVQCFENSYSGAIMFKMDPLLSNPGSAEFTEPCSVEHITKLYTLVSSSEKNGVNTS